MKGSNSLPTLVVSPSAIAAADDFVFAEIEEIADKAASYARSVAEAAFRRERLALHVHLAQLRLVTIEAIRCYKSLGDSREAGAP